MKIDWAKLHHDVAFGISDGKIIWQPRVACWFYDKQFHNEPLPEPFTGNDLLEIYRKLHCSARLYQFFNECFEAFEHSITVSVEELTETDAQTTITTPVGKQVVVQRKTPNSPRTIFLKREITTRQELKIAIWRNENTHWRWNQAAYEKYLTLTCEFGAPTMYMPRITLQDLCINKMGVENTLYALYDWPDYVEAYFRSLDESHDRLIDIINSCPIDIINFGDNIHAGITPPKLFCRHILPSYQRRCEKLHNAGKFITAHWDGDTRPLLPYAKETGLDGIEAITPRPQGDVSLAEIKQALGDQMFLLDGIPAILFDDTYGQDILIDYTHQLIDLFAPRLILGISDELSSTGDINRINLVTDIVNQYNNTGSLAGCCG